MDKNSSKPTATEDFLKIFQIVLDGYGRDERDDNIALLSLRAFIEESGDMLPLVDLHRLVSDHQY